jgi:hypothetical protein
MGIGIDQAPYLGAKNASSKRKKTDAKENMAPK